MDSLSTTTKTGSQSSIISIGRGLDTTPRLHIHDECDPMRGQIERHIQQRYHQRFGATIHAWFPILVSVQADGQLLAAAGYRKPNEAFFLERYLGRSAESCLNNVNGLARHHVVEAGQFASIRAGAGRLLVPLIARHLHEQGYAWAFCTLTRELHHLFTRIGMPTRPLSVASPSCLDADERVAWGSYYDHEPRVYAGRLAAIANQLGRSES